jgi:ribosomal protein S18 acetylase RimI-like enzyme
MSNISIISLPQSRWQEYRALRLQALQTDPTAFARTYDEDAALSDTNWQDKLNGTTACMVFAECEGKLIGMVGAFFDQGSCVQHRATIVAMYVMPSFRGQGIAKQLMQVLIDKLMAHPHIIYVSLTVRTNNVSAIKLYGNLGFKNVGVLEKSVYINGMFHDSYIMVKILDK